MINIDNSRIAYAAYSEGGAKPRSGSNSGAAGRLCFGEELKQLCAQWSAKAQAMGPELAQRAVGEGNVPVYTGSSAIFGILLDASGPLPDILARLKSGGGITQREWDKLCTELKNQGLISQTDYNCTRGNYRLIPVGSTGSDGIFTPYERIPGMSEKLQTLAKYMSDPAAGLEAYFSDDWQGDPLVFLDQWMAELREWRDHLTAQQNPDGSQKYPDLTPITKQMDSCQRVSDTLRQLL